MNAVVADPGTTPVVSPSVLALVGDGPRLADAPSANEPLAEAAQARRIFLVRPKGDGWEVVYGHRGDAMLFATLVEARGSAFGAAWWHWRKRGQPTGVQEDGAAQLCGRFG